MERFGAAQADFIPVGRIIDLCLADHTGRGRARVLTDHVVIPYYYSSSPTKNAQSVVTCGMWMCTVTNLAVTAMSQIFATGAY